MSNKLTRSAPVRGFLNLPPVRGFLHLPPVRATTDVLGTGYHEIAEKPLLNKVGTGVLAGSAAVAQAYDRVRYSVQLTPYVATQILSSTTSIGQHGIIGEAASSALAGLGAGATFAAWNGVVGTLLAGSLETMPDTRRYIGKRFRRSNAKYSKITPGLYERHISKKTHLARGLGVVGMGTTAYVTSAALNDTGKGPSPLRMNAESSLEGGVAVSGIVGGVAFAISRLASSNPELADRIMSVAENEWTWRLVSIAMVIGAFTVASMKKEDDFGQTPIEQE